MPLSFMTDLLRSGYGSVNRVGMYAHETSPEEPVQCEDGDCGKTGGELSTIGRLKFAAWPLTVKADNITSAKYAMISLS
jgi:hypothetical protein